MLSMTGFGRGEAASPEEKISFTAELSSVNRKQFELRFIAPPELALLEANARKIISKYFTRGAIQLRIQFRRDQSAANYEFNDALLSALTAKAMEIRRTIGVNPEVNVETLMTVPGVMISKSTDAACPGFVAAFEAAVTAAADACQQMRRDEGESLYRDLMHRTTELERLFGVFKERSAMMTESVRKRLIGKLEKERLAAHQRLVVRLDVTDDTLFGTMVGERMEQLSHRPIFVAHLCGQIEPAVGFSHRQTVVEPQSARLHRRGATWQTAHILRYRQRIRPDVVDDAVSQLEIHPRIVVYGTVEVIRITAERASEPVIPV